MSCAKYTSLDHYMGELSHYPLLNQQQEFEIGKKASSGDEKAIETLVRSNLRLVVKIAYDFKGLGLGLNDLIAEGNLGLVIASRKFNPEKGAKFSSYSAYWIKQYIRNAIAKCGRTIRIPIQSLSRISKIYKAKSYLTMTMSREPSIKELSEHLDIPEKSISRLEKVDTSTLSLDKKFLNTDSNSELIEVVKDPDEKSIVDNLLLKEDLKDLSSEFDSLKDKEQRVLTWRYGLDGNPPRTLEEISQEIKLSREGVRQIEKRSLRSLRRLIKKRRMNS